MGEIFTSKLAAAAPPVRASMLATCGFVLEFLPSSRAASRASSPASITAFAAASAAMDASCTVSPSARASAAASAAASVASGPRPALAACRKTAGGSLGGQESSGAWSGRATQGGGWAWRETHIGKGGAVERSAQAQRACCRIH